MRIGIEGGSWGNIRGYGRFTRELIQAMLHLDHRNEYILLLDPYTPRDSVPGGLSIITVPTREMPARAASADGYRSPRDLWAFSRAITSAPIDVIFFPSVYTFVPVLRRLKTVVGIHDVIAEKFPQFTFKGRRAQVFWNLKTRLAVGQASRVLTVSDHARVGIQKHFHIVSDKIRVTHEAPSKSFHPVTDRTPILAVQRQLGLDPEARTIVYLGGISPHKNLQMLVKVFASLVRDQRFANIKLLIVGEIAHDAFLSDYQAVRTIVDADCPDSVVFTGYMDDQSVACLLTTAEAFVMPSWDEGFGLPGIEAAACGAPVIATQSSALPEILGDAALYIDPANPDELREALVRVLLDASLRRSMSERGIQRASKLTWEATAQRVIEVFDELGGSR